MQVDFVLFVRASLDALRTGGEQWWTETLLYCERQSGPFEIFARARSTEYFKNVARLLDIKSKQDLADMLLGFQEKSCMRPNGHGIALQRNRSWVLTT